jgi:Bacterial pre-peptidase C-terminal domain
MHHLARWSATFLLIGCLLLPWQNSRGQGDNSIAYGQTVNGRITDQAFRVVYVFNGAAGEIVDAVLQRTEGNLDPLLLLLDGNNTVLAYQDDGAPQFGAVLANITLPADGTYYVVASRFGQQEGSTNGAFSLTLKRVGIAGDPRLRESAAPINFGDSSVQSLDDSQPQVLYTFGALRGEVITIQMQRVSGDLDPTLILADATGKVLLINDEDPDSPGTLDAAIRDFRIPESGNYLVAAMRFGGASGTTRGAYNLSLNRLGGDSLGLSPETAAALDTGSIASGEISDEVIQRYYWVRVSAGQTLRIEVKRTSGNLDPVISLTSLDLRTIVEQDNRVRGQSARITAYKPPIDATLLVVVSRFNGQTGRTAGSYEIRLSQGGQ